MASGSAPQSRTSLPRRTLTLENSVAAELAGSGDSVLRALRDRTTSKVHLRGNLLTLEGEDAEMDQAAKLVDEMVDLIENGHEVEPETLNSVTNAIQSSKRSSEVLKDVVWHNRNTTVAPKTVNQKVYVDSIRENTVTFGIGPAGTGKTFLAVAMAAAALVEGEVRRIILTRPAVEAGESLGFLPGDLQAKVDPYLRPLFDALYDMLDPDRVNGYFDRGVIEVAPLAFMRGRTLNDAFVILDEAQNTTPEQMKMFLTRLGFNSKMVVTGDVTQIDLPKERQSGLVVVREILDGIDDVSFVRFDGADVVRHRLVQRPDAPQGQSTTHRDRRHRLGERARGKGRPGRRTAEIARLFHATLAPHNQCEGIIAGRVFACIRQRSRGERALPGFGGGQQPGPGRARHRFQWFIALEAEPQAERLLQLAETLHVDGFVCGRIPRCRGGLLCDGQRGRQRSNEDRQGAQCCLHGAAD